MRVLPQSTSAAILNAAKAVKYYVHLNLKKKENKLSMDRILKWQLDHVVGIIPHATVCTNSFLFI